MEHLLKKQQLLASALSCVGDQAIFYLKENSGQQLLYVGGVLAIFYIKCSLYFSVKRRNKHEKNN